MAKSTDFLTKLEDVQDTAVVGGPGLVNTHVHLPPNYSAFDSVEQAVDLAAQCELLVLGVDNYYDYSVYKRFSQAAQKKGIFPLFNTEIIALDKDFKVQGVRVNDPGNPGKYYIGGKGITRFDLPSPRAQHILRLIRENDQRRMAAMVAKIAIVFTKHGVETNLDDVALRQQLAQRYGCDAGTIVLQERHIAQAFQEAFFECVEAEARIKKFNNMFSAVLVIDAEDASGCQQAIRSHLMKVGKPCYVEETFVNLAQARELIHHLGGIACYPVLADGTTPHCEYEATPATLVKNLRDHYYFMAEFITLRNSPEVLCEYVTAVRQAGIAVVAGTEHNTMTLSNMLPLCRNGIDVPEKMRSTFWEGTCVAVAHQYLRAQGEMGFVDDQGQPNPSFKDSESRIAHFYRLGAAVIDAYRRKLP
ncbi:MAG: hypothetical protein JW709_09845 [Sedimentisphaerales bacterium]|nr:hypothetical protein [Sedimentisphaerales bacterium]